MGLASFYNQISGNPRDMTQLEQYHRDMLCCYMMRPVMSPMLMRGVAPIEEFPFVCPSNCSFTMMIFKLYKDQTD